MPVVKPIPDGYPRVERVPDSRWRRQHHQFLPGGARGTGAVAEVSAAAGA